MAEIVCCLSLLPGQKRVKMSLVAIRQVTVVVFPQVQAVDVFGPVEVFSAANRLAGGDEYAIELVSARAGSVCTRAFLLAEAGLLDGRRATTHWAACDELARRYPAVAVERDPIFIRDGSSDTPIDVVATECGFGTVETLRRAFQRRVGASPSQYRERFRPALNAA
jgi:transcriptional regulator GlxA family with amidase domain